MNKRVISLLISLIIIVSGIYLEQHKTTSPKTNPQFDYSIKAEEGVPIKVAHVIDGDTIELINSQRIRYIGIDTPEEFDERKPVQCFAVAAAEKNREWVEGKMITFHKDVSPTDKYNRLLGFIYLADGTFVNLELVRQGYAFAYPYAPDISKTQEFRQAEEYARTNKLGLWSGCQIYKTSSGREQTNPVE